MMIELVVILPITLVILLGVPTALARVSHERGLLQAAAASASRAAALTDNPGDAQDQARQSADATLKDGGRSCAQHRVTVDTTDFGPGGQVVVRIDCTVSLSDLAIPGLPGTTHLTSTATTPLETYRAFAGVKP